MKARLLVRLRPGETRAFELPEEAVLGRDEGLAVSLPFEEVSRRHARISWDGTSHWLEDLESTNGTFLNGRRVQKEKLRHLSVVTLGTQTDLVFVVRPEETGTLRRRVIQHAFLVPDSPDAPPHDIPAGEFTIGRSPACSIVSESAEVSKLHARIVRGADKLRVRDLGSANGTWVNGVRVTDAPLVDGDLLAFGNDRYRVSVALSEVTSTTVTALRVEELAAAPPAAEDPQQTPRFSTAWKRRVEGLEQAARALEAGGDDTDRRSAGADQTLHPATTQAAAVSAAGRIEVRLLGEGVELVAAGGGTYVVGSAPAAQLRLEHPSVLGSHARLIVSDVLGSVFLHAEEGPTLRNGEKVEKTEPLLDGDSVRLGEVLVRVAIRRVD